MLFFKQRMDKKIRRTIKYFLNFDIDIKGVLHSLFRVGGCWLLPKRFLLSVENCRTPHILHCGNKG